MVSVRLFAAVVVLMAVSLTSVDAAKLRKTRSERNKHHSVGNVDNALVHSRQETKRGQCAASGLCCQGKDNNCRATPSSMSGKGKIAESDLMDSNSTHDRRGACFCDSACLELGDCCEDYKTACQPVDCVLADQWDNYGECSSRCGPGIRERRRRVLQRPMNGGKPCGKTIEKIPCDGTNCKVARAPNGYEELRETAYVIPAIYGAWRKSKRYDPFSDIRRNLFEHYDAKSVIKRPAYCMVFELTEVRSGCNLTNSVVSSSGSPSSSPDTSIAWVSQLVEGQSVCVECQPTVMKQSLGGRCRGHGVLSKETRWDAVTVPGCRGRWVMKSRQEDCQCKGDKDGQLSSFILV